MTAVQFAHKAIKAHLSVIAVEPSTKRPSYPWKPFQERPPTDIELDLQFTNGQAPAIICGKVSGGLECMDFDVPGKYFEWLEVLDDWNMGSLRDRLTIRVQTPSGGYHVWYRCPNPEGNLKLAYVESVETPGTLGEIAIETRGEGGYALVPPSPRYKMVEPCGSFGKIPEITAEEREGLLNAARSLSYAVEAPERKETRERRETDGETPWDAFNARADWRSILEARGWRWAGQSRGSEFYKRPGKSKVGHSASVTNGFIHVFTSNAMPLESGKNYTPYGFITAVDHGGNASESAKWCLRNGYGKSNRQQSNSYAPVAADAQDGDSFDVRDAFDYEPETPEWLVPGFIRIGQINLLDAKESGGKSTYCLAIAAAGSNGRDIYGQEIEPFVTIYFAIEDSPGEIRAKFEQLGGKRGYLKVFPHHFVLSPEGMEKVANTIQKTGAKLIIFDPLRTYVTGIVRNQLDGLQWIPIFEAQRRIASDMRVAVVNIRHHAALTKGREFSEMGSGVAEWRSLHRTHTTLISHPDAAHHNSYRYCIPCRGSLNAVQHEAMGFSYDRGEFGWDFEPDMAPLMEAYSTKDKQKTGPPPTTRTEVEGWLKATLDAGFCRVGEIRRMAANAGYNSMTLYRAVKSLNVAESGEKGRKEWHLFDPFLTD